jgi:hypothetical protein
MTKQVIGFGMYGMYGPFTDPGEREFTARVKDLGVDVRNSPYRDYDVTQIVAEILAAPADAIIFVWGSSLGANNAPVVGAYVPHRIIDGMWGFQASLDGAQVGITPNVKFAHEVWNPSSITDLSWFKTFGFGAYEWVKALGNTKTNLYTSKRDDFHPGETLAAQEMFLGEMKRIIAASQLPAPQVSA